MQAFVSTSWHHLQGQPKCSAFYGDEEQAAVFEPHLQARGAVHGDGELQVNGPTCTRLTPLPPSSSVARTCVRTPMPHTSI